MYQQMIQEQKLLLSIDYTVICEIGILIKVHYNAYIVASRFCDFTFLFLICLRSGGSARGEHCNGQPHLGYESCAPHVNACLLKGGKFRDQ